MLKAYLNEIGMPYEEKRLVEDLLYDAEVMTELIMKGIMFKSAPVMQIGTEYFGPQHIFKGNELQKDMVLGLVEA